MASITLVDEDDNSFMLKLNQIKIDINNTVKPVMIVSVDNTSVLSGSFFNECCKEIYNLFYKIVHDTQYNDYKIFNCTIDEEGNYIIKGI